MLSDTFFGLVALLYYVGSGLLVGLVLFIAFHGGHRPCTRAQSRLRRTFFLLALSLLLWQLSLFLEVRTTRPAAQLWLGRVNFTAVVFAASLALRFVQEVPGESATRRSSAWSFGLLAETGLVAALTLLTPLVDTAERVEAGQAISTYGPLFPAYLIHVLGCLGAALMLALREWRRAKNRAVRGQLTLIGLGMLATGGIASLTNALLPYAFGDFRYGDVGTLSTLLFALAIAYATLIHRLFDPRVLLRETLVYGILLAFVLGTYSSTLFLVTQVLTSSAGKLVQFSVLVIAFSFDPLRRFLEKKTDQLLFGGREVEGKGKKPRRRGSGRGAGSALLALLFPWRRP